MARSSRLVIAVLVSALLLAACGQKSGVAGTGGSDVSTGEGTSSATTGGGTSGGGTSGGGTKPTTHQKGADDTPGSPTRRS